MKRERSSSTPDHRELLFRVTASDCEWQFLRGSGPGGQNRNKSSTAVRCVHRAIGAMGYAEDSRSQWDNRRAAFARMADSNTFRAWLRLEAARRTGALLDAEAAAERAMAPHLLRVDCKDENGRWVTVLSEDDLSDGDE